MCTEFGGRAVLEKLASRTARWAAFELAQEAARRVDDRPRQRDENADALQGRVDRQVNLLHTGLWSDSARPSSTPASAAALA